MDLNKFVKECFERYLTLMPRMLVETPLFHAAHEHSVTYILDNLIFKGKLVQDPPPDTEDWVDLPGYEGIANEMVEQNPQG